LEQSERAREWARDHLAHMMSMHPPAGTWCTNAPKLRSARCKLTRCTRVTARAGLEHERAISLDSQRGMMLRTNCEHNQKGERETRIETAYCLCRSEEPAKGGSGSHEIIRKRAKRKSKNRWVDREGPGNPRKEAAGRTRCGRRRGSRPGRPYRRPGPGLSPATPAFAISTAGRAHPWNRDRRRSSCCCF
jgi:hypothetical protein